MVYWGYNPLTNHLLTSWDIQVPASSDMFKLLHPIPDVTTPQAFPHLQTGEKLLQKPATSKHVCRKRSNMVAIFEILPFTLLILLLLFFFVVAVAVVVVVVTGRFSTYLRLLRSPAELSGGNMAQLSCERHRHQKRHLYSRDWYDLGEICTASSWSNQQITKHVLSYARICFWN